MAETIIKQYSEEGICYSLMTMNIRTKPCASTGTILDQYYAGESVIYDYVVITDKYVWISWTGSSGRRVYMAVKDQITGERFGSCEDIPSGSNGAEAIVSEYFEHGICYPRMSINVRNRPCALTGTVLDQYHQGESVIYDYVVITRNYVWISWIGGSGNRVYMAIKDQATGERFGDCADVPGSGGAAGLEAIVSEYPESGMCYPQMTINVRSKPCATTGEVLDQYYLGESVIYDYVIITNKFVWISWIGFSGRRVYMAVKDQVTGERFGICGDITGGGSGGGSIGSGDSTVRILQRHEWGANPVQPSGMSGKRTTPIRHIVLHHTADVQTSSDISHMKGIQNTHQGWDWGDIGYNFGIGKNGTVMEGRSLDENGAHTKGIRNTDSIGICVFGNFENIELSAEQKNKLVPLLVLLCKKYGLKGKDISAHRDHNSTACPGMNFYNMLASIRQTVDTRLQSGSGSSDLSQVFTDPVKFQKLLKKAWLFDGFGFEFSCDQLSAKSQERLVSFFPNITVRGEMSLSPVINNGSSLHLGVDLSSKEVAQSYMSKFSAAEVKTNFSSENLEETFVGLFSEVGVSIPVGSHMKFMITKGGGLWTTITAETRIDATDIFGGTVPFANVYARIVIRIRKTSVGEPEYSPVAALSFDQAHDYSNSDWNIFSPKTKSFISICIVGAIATAIIVGSGGTNLAPAVIALFFIKSS